MLKNISNLGRALRSSEQQKLTGGGKGSGNLCSTVCVTQGYGHLCDLHNGCPGANDGMCDGNGGYFYL